MVLYEAQLSTESVLLASSHYTIEPELCSCSGVVRYVRIVPSVLLGIMAEAMLPCSTYY